MKFSKRLVTALYKLFVDEPFSFIGKPLYKTIVAIELTVHRTLLSQQKHNFGSGQDLVNIYLTVIIKTYERPDALRRLVASIKSIYPDLHIIVVDDSQHPQKISGVETVVLPHNQGLAAGRNEALKRVKTDYFLLLDDDFVFYRHTNLESPLTTLLAYPQIDIMGGEVVDLPFYTATNYRDITLSTNGQATMPPGSSIAELPVFDMVANFFLGQTERVQLVGWDPNLKKMEHSDFFTRAKGVLTTVFNKDLKILHARTPFDTEYMQQRQDDLLERAILTYRYDNQQPPPESD